MGLVVPHDPGCEGFTTPASHGQIRCRCWAVGQLTPWGSSEVIEIQYHGSALSDEEVAEWGRAIMDALAQTADDLGEIGR